MVFSFERNIILFCEHFSISRAFIWLLWLKKIDFTIFIVRRIIFAFRSRKIQSDRNSPSLFHSSRFCGFLKSGNLLEKVRIYIFSKSFCCLLFSGFYRSTFERSLLSEKIFLFAMLVLFLNLKRSFSISLGLRWGLVVDTLGIS